MKKFIFSLLLALVSISFVNAQILEPVKWTIDKESLGNDEYNLIFKANIEKGWTVYSQYTNDEGPVPTSLNYDNPEVVELLGKATETGKKKEGHDKVFDLDVIKFLADKPFIVTQKVKVNDYSKPLVGYLTFMTCDATKCLPPVDIDFEFEFTKESSEGSKSKAVENSTASTKIITAAQNAEPVNEVKKAVSKIKAPQTITAEPKAVTKVANKSITQKSETSNSDEIFSPVKWTIELNNTGGDEHELIATAQVHPDWNTYSMFTPDGGPLPTELIFEGQEGIELIAETMEFGNKKAQNDPLFDNIKVIKFLSDQPHIIKQKIKIKDPSKPISGYLSYMACDKSHCIPPTDVEFKFMPANGKTNNQFVVGDSGQTNLGGTTVNTSSNLGPQLDGNVLNQSITTIQESYNEPIGDCGTQVQDAKGSHWKIFLGGFLGGLVAILLPCIFPMIPITVSFFTKDTNRKGWANGLIYGLSIVAIFVSIGLAITALLGPTALNELSTNWIANVIFFIIFIAFAISFFGYYEITLPSSWSTKSDSMADKGGLIGIFFMAATLAIVSFSCTGPIIGSALVQVADNKLGPFFIMLGFSLALAIPFGLFAAFPAWLNSLPRSGSWMNSVKVVLGFLELALALKFLSVADMTSNWGFLKYELFMGLWVIIFAAMTAYLFGLFKFPHDSPVKKLTPVRMGFAILSLIWTIYIATGFTYDAGINSYKIPKLVSGITPPASYNFLIEKRTVDTKIKDRYKSYSKCANDINCFKDYYDGIAYANEVNKPVLLDFTGHGCVNCRKTEDYIWKDPVIKNMLNDDFVLVSLYVDDRKKLPETLISAADGGKLRNVGNKWAEFQVINFEQNSQPLYVPMMPDQRVITAPRGYEEGVDNYKAFLDCSLENYNKEK